MWTSASDRQFCAHQCVEPRAHLAVRLPQKLALLEQALGEKFDPTVYTQYLEEKYGEIYGL